MLILILSPVRVCNMIWNQKLDSFVLLTLNKGEKTGKKYLKETLSAILTFWGNY